MGGQCVVCGCIINKYIYEWEVIVLFWLYNKYIYGWEDNVLCVAV